MSRFDALTVSLAKRTVLELRRTTPNAFDPSLVAVFEASDDFKSDEIWKNSVFIGKSVIIKFPRFGEDAKRQSDFEVCAEWKDVERMIEIFCESAHPQALALRNAVKLAAAAEELGWQPPTLP
jgi:hypothetical protein